MPEPKRALIFEDVILYDDNGTTDDIVAVAWDNQPEGEAGVTLEFWPLDNKSTQVLLSLDDLRRLIDLTEER